MKYVNCALLFLLFSFVVSCENEIVESNDIRTAGIWVNIDGYSRTSVNSNHQILWSEGDKISVFGSDGLNREYELSKGAGNTSAFFVGEEGENDLAFYPYNETNSYNNSTQTLHFTLPDEFTFNSKNINQFPMIGRFLDDGSDNVSFRNIGALLSVTLVNIPFNYTYITLSSEDKSIAGNAEVSWDNGMPQMEIKDDASASKTITIDFEASSTPTTKTFHFMLPVADYSKLTIQAGVVKEGTAVSTIKSAPLNVVRNGHYELTHYMNGSYAVKSDGTLIPSSDIQESLSADEKDNYIAVAIIDDEDKFMLGKLCRNGIWGSRNQTICGEQYTGNDGGKSDKEGKENTINGILSEDNLQFSGIGQQLISYRNESVFKDWYIPSAGQAYELIYQNKGAINSVLSKIGNTIPTANYWTSTEYDKDQAWYITDQGYVSYNYKDVDYSVWFIRDF